MRRCRLIVVTIALLGVLLHTGLLARHGAMMLQKQLLDADLAAAAGVICHHDGSTAPGAPATRGPGGQDDCPICQGMITAVVVPEAPPAVALRPLLASRIISIGERIALRLAWLSASPRGPPADLA